MAERERERAHEAEPVRELDHGRRLRGDERGARRLEAEDLDPLLRAHGAERLSVHRRAAAAASDPLLAGAEVVDVREEHVLHPLAVGNRQREAEKRDAALRVQGAVDRIDDDHGRAAFDATGLFGDDRDVEIAEPREDRVLGRFVDRGRGVATEPLADDRLALDARRQLLEDGADVQHRRAAEAEPVRHNGRKSSPPDPGGAALTFFSSSSCDQLYILRTCSVAVAV